MTKCGVKPWWAKSGDWVNEAIRGMRFRFWSASQLKLLQKMNAQTESYPRIPTPEKQGDACVNRKSEPETSSSVQFIHTMIQLDSTPHLATTGSSNLQFRT